MMIVLDGFLDNNAPLNEARRRLAEPTSGEPAFRMVCAAALLAASACCLAMAVILGPFWQINNSQIMPEPSPVASARVQATAPATAQIGAIVAPPPPPATAPRHGWR